MRQNQIPRPEERGMLLSRGGCTQGFNTFLIALKGGVLNPFGTNKNPTKKPTLVSVANSNIMQV